MLSSTHTITDIKAKLVNGYVFFGFASDAFFVTALTVAVDDVFVSYYLPKIGLVEYNIIKAKNKVGLDSIETYLYWAEVYASCFEFLKQKSAIDGQLQNSSDETLTVEGYTHRIGSGSRAGASAGDLSISYYWNKTYQYFKFAGIDIMALQRTCTIFGDSSYDPDMVDIIPLP